MESALSDADCVAHSLSEPKAFEPIFDRHFVAVHRYLHRRVGQDVADELAAETFAVAFERRATCRGESALPWLYGIATNLLRRRWRAERRQLRAYARSGVDRWADHEEETASRVDAAGAQLAGALRRCVRESVMRCCSTRSLASATRRSPLPSTSRSGRFVRGCTGHARSLDASSRRSQTLSHS